MLLPTNKKDLLALAKDLVAICQVSQGQRSAAYRQYAQWVETGRQAGGLALGNLLYSHVDRLHSHLFSPSDLRFSIDFENPYKPETLAQAEQAGRVLTREWERRNIDTVFASGVRESLVYGACPIKQLVSGDGDGNIEISARLVMPWNFGVYNENVNEILDQECVLETVYLSRPEIWRRVQHLPDAEKIFTKITSNADRNSGTGSPTSFFHQVLSTAALNTSGQNPAENIPGGLVSLTTSPNFAQLGPQVAAELYPFHELWVKDDKLNDWVTIQLCEPDILVSPLLARKNLFVPGVLPYGMVRCNEVANYFWGRSELVDLMLLQQNLSVTMDDIKRLMGQQFDKLLAFTGDGLTDELYGQFRAQGYANLGPNGSVQDLTPKMPAEAFSYIKLLMDMMEKAGGFSNILSGQGEAGVRAGNHADMLMKTASPRLRDRALIIERQCASFADMTLSIMEAKDSKAYWPEGHEEEGGEFLLSLIPEDRRVCVDSHSSSPIYQDDHKELLFAGLKAGFIGGDTLIEELPFNKKEILLQRFKLIQEERKAQAQQQAALEQEKIGAKAAKK